MTRSRVTLWSVDSSFRGRDTVKAIIDDAKKLGVRTLANGPGTSHFTLPYNHPQINQCLDTATGSPQLRHYEVSRWNGSAYQPVAQGLLDDYDATANEVIFYGRDYLSLFDSSISASDTSYTDTQIGDIITEQVSAAIGQRLHEADDADPDSRLGFLTMDIDSATATASIISAFEPRLQFIGRVINILQAGTSTRPIISVTRTTPFKVQFRTNQGADKPHVVLEYGGNVDDFRYVPGWAQFATEYRGIGQKRDGAAIIYSIQTIDTAPQSVHGIIQRANVYLDQIDTTTFDQAVLRDLRQADQIGKSVFLRVASGKVAPWDGYDLGDSVRIRIKRGIVDVNELMTVWGLEWSAEADGSELLQLALLPKLT